MSAGDEETSRALVRLLQRGTMFQSAAPIGVWRDLLGGRWVCFLSYGPQTYCLLPLHDAGAAGILHDHEHLSRVFTRAIERYMRRSKAYHDHMLCGQSALEFPVGVGSSAWAPDSLLQLRLARQAVALVARLAALHPLTPMLDGLQGPLHKRGA